MGIHILNLNDVAMTFEMMLTARIMQWNSSVHFAQVCEFATLDDIIVGYDEN